ncbi:MAG: putative amidohydrolase, partial [Actinomycetia bacterium]|nr:putative amidohydrolase [Actinomycetes bacterium]
SDSLWPAAPEALHENFARYNVPDEDINKITYENAMRWYHFDPFTHVPKEQATVGALRASAAGHDVSIKPRSHNNPAAEDKLAQYRMRAQAAFSKEKVLR